MNHDACHCLDYDKGKCPVDCYRAQLTQELICSNYQGLSSWSNFEGTKHCRLGPPDDYQPGTWIRTDERLPGMWEPVIVWFKGRWRMGERVYLTGDQWMIYGKTAFRAANPPAYWMPGPEKPQKEGSAKND